MNIPSIELSPDIIAYVSLAVSTLKRFIPPEFIQVAAPCIAISVGGILGFISGGPLGIINGIAGGLTAIGMYEGSKQGGKKLVLLKKDAK